MGFDDLLQIAIERMCEMPQNGRAFEFKELFTGTEWNQLSNGEKRSYGAAFARLVRSNGLEGVRVREIDPNSRHNKYQVY